MGESSFWYRPTRVVPDQRPLNGRCVTYLKCTVVKKYGYILPDDNAWVYMHAFCCIFACALYLHVHWYLINIVYFLPPCILHLWATRGIMFSTCPSVRACARTSVSAGVVSGLLSNSSLMGIQMTIPLLIFIKLFPKKHARQFLMDFHN